MGQGKVGITFYHMRGCGPCAQFRPVWEELLEAVGSSEYIVTNSFESAEEECKEIASFPTIMITVANKKYKYNGQRTLDDLLDFVYKKVASAVEKKGGNRVRGSRKVNF